MKLLFLRCKKEKKKRRIQTKFTMGKVARSGLHLANPNSVAQTKITTRKRENGNRDSATVSNSWMHIEE